jgi:hypothetical protein
VVWSGTLKTALLWPGVAATGANPPMQRVAQCGAMKAWTIWLNWYMNEYTRLMFDYSQFDLGTYPLTPVNLNPGGTKADFDGATIRGFGMRASSTGKLTEQVPSQGRRFFLTAAVSATQSPL